MNEDIISIKSKRKGPVVKRRRGPVIVNKEIGTCPICHDEYNLNSVVHKFNCSHKVCNDCFKDQFNFGVLQQRILSRLVCCLCRADVNMDNLTEQEKNQYNNRFGFNHNRLESESIGSNIDFEGTLPENLRLNGESRIIQVLRRLGVNIASLQEYISSFMMNQNSIQSDDNVSITNTSTGTTSDDNVSITNTSTGITPDPNIRINNTFQEYVDSILIYRTSSDSRIGVITRDIITIEDDTRNEFRTPSRVTIRDITIEY